MLGEVNPTFTKVRVCVRVFMCVCVGGERVYRKRKFQYLLCVCVCGGGVLGGCNLHTKYFEILVYGPRILFLW